MRQRKKTPASGNDKPGLARLKDMPASRKVTFIVDRDMKKTESIVLPMLLSNNGLTDKTHLASFNEFFSDASSMRSDVLVIRSSRVFFHSQDNQAKLKEAVRDFKKTNPDSVIFLFAIGYSGNMLELKSQNIVDAVFHDNTAGEDPGTVAQALKILEARPAE